MQCVHCLSAERLRVAVGRTDDPIIVARRAGPIVCSTCGGPLETGALKDRVAAKLAQLARFGLAGGARPLFGGRNG